MHRVHFHLKYALLHKVELAESVNLTFPPLVSCRLRHVKRELANWFSNHSSAGNNNISHEPSCDFQARMFTIHNLIEANQFPNFAT
jgi:hypothetical protein